MLDGAADLAVHSAKDLPAVTGEGLVLAAVPERGDPRDALVGAALADLPSGATVATGSQRRRVQLAELRPDLVFVELRGNMATRLGEGARRGARSSSPRSPSSGWASPSTWPRCSTSTCWCRRSGRGLWRSRCGRATGSTLGLVAAIEHAPSRRRVDAERAFLAELGGDCDLPAGAHAVLAGGAEAGGEDVEVVVQALLAGPDGTVHRATDRGLDGVAVGAGLARTLRSAAGAA